MTTNNATYGKLALRAIWPLLLALMCMPMAAQNRGTLKGRVVCASADNGDIQAVPYASVVIEGGAWAVTDIDGRFALGTPNHSEFKVSVMALGYADFSITVPPLSHDTLVEFTLQEQNLKLREVVVTARQADDPTSAYVIDHAALEHQQLTNVSQISELLPGGKTVANGGNLALTDSRLQLRSQTAECGNAAFGTAVEIDGVRLNNNGDAVETKSPDLRGISTSNVEAVEVLTGIPSAEHGDLTSGLVRVRTRKGRSPLSIELSTSPNTKQAAVAKGFALADGHGTVNVAYDLTRSLSNLASPYTSYLRNALNIRYANTLKGNFGTLALDAIAQGNIGGLNSKSDPDAFVNTYSQNHDRHVRLSAHGRWLAQLKWLTEVDLSASCNFADRQKRQRTNASEASSQPQIHALTEGYNIAQRYDDDPQANIILSPTGYWYVESRNDNRPLASNLKLKANLVRQVGSVNNNLMLGAEWSHSANYGRGLTYADMRLAPTWREYRYDKRPALNTLAAYVEDKLSAEVGGIGIAAMMGIRGEQTRVKGSEYKPVSSLSPRLSARFTLIDNGCGAVSRLLIGGGWGKAVKLPSFQVLNPRPTYYDQMAFAAGSQADGTAFYAYYSCPKAPQYNSNLRWQYAIQKEVNIDVTLWGAHITVSAYSNNTYAPYMELMRYEPLAFRYTSAAAAERCPIGIENRRYSIDAQTGIVSVADITGALPTQELDSEVRNRLVANSYYGNGSVIRRKGIDFVIDMPKIKRLNTLVRIDGKYYTYRSLDQTLVQWCPTSTYTTAGQYYPYIGHYVGALQLSVPTAESGAQLGTVANGKATSRLDINTQFSTNIPVLRIVLSTKVEATLVQKQRYLCEQDGGPRGYASEGPQNYLATDQDIYAGERYVAAYPKYYSTVDDPEHLLPFEETFRWAKDNNPRLYTDLRSLVLRSNTANYFNRSSITAYLASNIRITKEIGNHVTMAFYATNFFNAQAKVTDSATGLSQTLFGSQYVSPFYYGLTLKIKI